MPIPIIRLASAADAAQIQAIYAPIVSTTMISFEFEPPPVDEMRRRIENTLAALPWLVCERDNMILGYAYAGKHRSRAAYQWSVDVSAYVHADVRRSGVGRALYTSLFAILRLQGFYNAYAGIGLPNPASVGLHEALGFTPVGVYRSVGYKFGAWHDVGWWQRTLQEHADAPTPPLTLAQINGSAGWGQALHKGLPLLRA
jgi:L-amino acid N-acyltransferase YncA